MFIIIKTSIQCEGKIIINIYAPNNRAPKYMKEKIDKIEREIPKSTKIVRNINT